MRRQWNGFNIALTELPHELISSSLTEPAKNMPASPSAATEEGVKGFPARTLLCGIALAIVLVTIALHFGLVDIGQWAYDELSLISSYRDNGWISFSTRLLHWSPRPVSEILIGSRSAGV